MYAKQKLSLLPLRGWLLICLVPALFLAALPSASRADSLEDAARALARKVAAVHKKDSVASYAWGNRSRLSAAASERMREAFEAEFERLRSRLELESHADLSVVITENPSQIYLLAEDTSQNNELISSVCYPKSQFTAAERTGAVLGLNRQLVWQQPDLMLDLAVSNDPANKPDVMLVLGGERLFLYRWEQEKWVFKDSTTLPRDRPSLRALRGEIRLDDHFFQFHLPGIECDGDAWQKLAFECEELAGIWGAQFDPTLPFSLDKGRNFFAVNPHYIGPKKFPLTGFFAVVPSHAIYNLQFTLAGADGHMYVYSTGNEREKIPEGLERLPVDWGSDLVQLSADCREESLVVASSAHDHSLPDTLQGFEVETRAVTPATAIAEFPGPILSLKNTTDSEAMAIVFNLTTGNYEAYRVTVACGD